MHETDELFRLMAEANPLGLWLIDPDGHSIYANRKMAELLGMSSEELARVQPVDVHDDEGKPQWIEHVAELNAGKQQQPVEVRYLRTDGSGIWLLAGVERLGRHRHRHRCSGLGGCHAATCSAVGSWSASTG